MTHENLQSGLGRKLGSFLNDRRIRDAVYQALTICFVVLGSWWIVDNTVTNLTRSNTVSGYSFLNGRAGFEISEKLIGYSSDSSYARALLVGFLNTVLIAVTGIVTATVVGFMIALGRLSSNWLVSRLCAIYVELFRNTPALLVIFIWYSGVLTLLPQPRDSLTLPFGALLNNRGMAVPSPVWLDGSWVVFAALVLSVVLVVILKSWSTRRQALTGRRFPVLWSSVALLVALPTAAFVASGAPVTFDIPVATRFNVTGGSTLSPEFVALYLAISLYTAAFIAEIIRAGIQGVSKGQSAARARASPRNHQASGCRPPGAPHHHPASDEPVSEPYEEFVARRSDRVSGTRLNRRNDHESDRSGDRDRLHLADRLSRNQPHDVGLHERAQSKNGVGGEMI